MAVRACARWAVRRMTLPSPRHRPFRGGPDGGPGGSGQGGAGSAWFTTLARQSRSAPELLASALGRRVIAHPLRHHRLTPTAPMPALRLPDDLDDLHGVEGVEGVEGVVLDEHLFIDARPPHPSLGLSYALIVPGRLPADVRSALHGERTLDQLLDAVEVSWSSETLDAEELTTGAASFSAAAPPDTPMLRLTRRLALTGIPVAIVLDEIPQPRPPGSPTREREPPLTHP